MPITHNDTKIRLSCKVVFRPILWISPIQQKQRLFAADRTDNGVCRTFSNFRPRGEIHEAGDTCAIKTKVTTAAVVVQPYVRRVFARFCIAQADSMEAAAFGRCR
jgi:hypothetical protein